MEGLLSTGPTPPSFYVTQSNFGDMKPLNGKTNKSFF